MIFVKSVGGSTIRDATINVADKEDLLFMLGLESLGMKRTVACVITFLKDQNERSSMDIEVATGLRQPEVSIAIQTLRERNWLTEHEIKSIGKGRPLKSMLCEPPSMNSGKWPTCCSGKGVVGFKRLE